MKIFSSVMTSSNFKKILLPLYKRFIKFQSYIICFRYTKISTCYLIFMLTFCSILFSYTQLVYSQPSKNLILEQNTTVILRLMQNVSTKNMKVGDQVEFTVVEDVAVDGKTVIEKGSIVISRVSIAEKPDYLGEPGFIQVAPQHVLGVDGQEVRLTGTYGSSGKDKETSTVICAALCLPLGLRKGGHPSIAEGTELMAIVERDYEIRVAD